MIKLRNIPKREELIRRFPPTDSLILLPGKEADEFHYPNKYPHEGERRTTLAQVMRPLVVKRKGEDYYEYDLHCVGIGVVGNDGRSFNKNHFDESFSQIYFLIGSGAYQKIVAPPIDPSLPEEVIEYLDAKYLELENFLNDLNIESLMSQQDKHSFKRGQKEFGGKQDGE